MINTGRDPDYVALNKRFTVDIIKAGNLINTFPSFLKQCVAFPHDIVKSKPFPYSSAL